jgi:hypothetical protein
MVCLCTSAETSPVVVCYAIQGTATLGKGLMARNDQFTKLMGDVNKDQRHL